MDIDVSLEFYPSTSASGFLNLNDFIFYLHDMCVTCKPRIGGKYKYAD